MTGYCTCSFKPTTVCVRVCMCVYACVKQQTTESPQFGSRRRGILLEDFKWKGNSPVGDEGGTFIESHETQTVNCQNICVDCTRRTRVTRLLGGLFNSPHLHLPRNICPMSMSAQLLRANDHYALTMPTLKDLLLSTDVCVGSHPRVAAKTAFPLSSHTAFKILEKSNLNII